MDHRAAAIMAILIALAIVAFWKNVIKYMIIIAATAVIGAFGYVVIVAMQNLHHVAK